MQTPSIGWLTVNRTCNNRCRWCYAKGTEFKNDDMDFGLARKLVDLLSEMKAENCIILGGEPTLYKKLPELIKYTIDQKIKPILITNGRRFADMRYAKMMASTGLKIVDISNKAPNAIRYKELTGADGFHEMIQGNRNLVALGLRPNCAITLVNEILPDLEEMIDGLLEGGARRIYFTMGSPVINNGDISYEGIPTPKELAQAIEAAHRLLKDKAVSYGFNVLTPLCQFDKEILRELIEAKLMVTCCHVQGGRGVVFGTTGQVLPCNHMHDIPLGSYGTDFVTFAEFKDFWEGSKAQEFRQLTRRYPSHRCVGCELWGICGGGCVLRWLSIDPEEHTRRARGGESNECC